MLLVSFGSPSAIAYAVTNIVRQALADAVGAHALFQVLHLEDFKEKWSAYTPEERRAVLVVSDCPHADIVDLFAATQGPILVSCDSFEHIVGYVMRSRGMTFAPAVRFATQVLCALDGLARAPNVLRVTRDDYGRDLDGLVASLVAFTGLPAEEAAFETTLAALAVGRTRSPETFRDYVERHFPHFADAADGLGLADEDAAAFLTLATHYAVLTEHRPFDTVDWPTSLFLDWDRPGQFLAGPIELLGPARFIVCGPYLHLPIGQWRMSVDVETRECFSDNRLGADVFCGRILSAVTMDLPKAAAFGFDIDFEIDNPLLPIELRVQLLTGAIEGRFRLLGVRLSRTGEGLKETDGARPSPVGRHVGSGNR